MCGQCRACKRGRPSYCFDTFNAEQKMTLTDGTELTPALASGHSPTRRWCTPANAPRLIPRPTPPWRACWVAA
ncbi:S-(hydroxymethyl)mycothiol dehydrogenase domain protein [Mycobacterium ulcerans str. Harvey]|uniref:S-(Hydroxymethyl)mycothiol dehydrogenase domain protein n=1 Tax=Mycobacterium ulcerans str. Harvey TaxID=1299332 RepID=A0ABN0R2Y9_MYCUL|nr:S-(hydroxymethyl)mycothiol dehydrogenase domain protein [Mycobacterium ulcerans str. Harvey]